MSTGKPPASRSDEREVSALGVPLLPSPRESGLLVRMEQIVDLHIERLPEGVYLATTEEIPGLVAQGRTVTETLEIARDVAKKLIEARSGLSGSTRLTTVGDTLALPADRRHLIRGDGQACRISLPAGRAEAQAAGL